ncbi:MAG: hypothetical protein JWR61_1109 [Ferruginibacter sp.]|uniref:hypothetical protein n=1 Tax=Ferruginibacter sp. TaxID=1940288 RepID=UPI00265B107B|nr:hypothetical protein [Ferruginibacter sp.]MDB5276154.1 hypothetical protein [Ferruginibacter sp.]
MKLIITDWIKNGSITPLNWGDSSEEISHLFSNSSGEIISLKQRHYPFIIIDFVEFYFSDDINFVGLNEIIIKPISLYKGIQTKSIDPGWLTQELSFENVSTKLTELQVHWHIERGPYYDTPNIRTESGQLFAFDPDRMEDNDAQLMKIYLRE